MMTRRRKGIDIFYQDEKKHKGRIIKFLRNSCSFL